MQHTRAALKKHRGLMMIVAALTVAFLLEPSVKVAGRACLVLIQYFAGGTP